MRTETEIRNKLKEYEENIEILKKSKLGNEELIQELTLESVIFKWILEEVDKI